MSNSPDNKLIPSPVFIMSLIVGVLSVLMVFDLPPMSAHDRDLLKGLILCLLTAIGLYFLLRKPISVVRDKYREIVKGRELTLDEEEVIPDEFAIEVVKKKGFAFCYPKTWFMTDANDPALYKEIREQMVEPGIASARNFNISHHDIRLAPDLDKMFKAIIDGVLFALKGSVFKYRQNFTSKKIIGMRYKVVYRNTKGLDLACYQIVMTTPKKKNMIIFTFTSHVTDFDKSKPLFDKIASLTKIND